MHEITESRTSTLTHLVLTTACLTEVCHRRQFRVHGPTSEPAVVQVLSRPFGVLLAAELDVHIAHQMVSQIVADVHLLDFAVLVLALHKDILEKVIVMLLHFLVRHVCHQVTSVRRFGRVLGIHVKILQQTGLRERRLVVDPRTTVPMAACSDLKVKRAVDLVLFCAENRGKILRHRVPLNWCPREDVCEQIWPFLLPQPEVAKRFFLEAE